MENRKSITLVSNNYWTLYKFRYEVVELFISKGYQVNLIASDDPYSDKFDHECIKKYYVPINNRGISFIDEFRTFINLFKIYKSLNSGLIFHFTIKPNIYGSIICRILRIKSISFITGIGHTFINKNLLQRTIIILYKLALSKVSEVWFTNNSDVNLFKSLSIIKRNKTRIVPGSGINTPDNIMKYEHSPKISFLMIARLQNEKGVMEYLKCSEYYKDNRDISFILIGDPQTDDPSGVQLDTINNYVDKKTITYMGYQEDIYKYIMDASCIVLPSYREGMSTVLLEASVHKRPIITTRVPGCEDIIKNSSYGILCEPRDYKSLLQAIQKFIKLDHLEISMMVEKTFDHVRKNFSKESVLMNYKSSISDIK